MIPQIIFYHLHLRPMYFYLGLCLQITILLLDGRFSYFNYRLWNLPSVKGFQLGKIKHCHFNYFTLLFPEHSRFIFSFFRHDCKTAKRDYELRHIGLPAWSNLDPIGWIFINLTFWVFFFFKFCWEYSSFIKIL